MTFTKRNEVTEIQPAVFLTDYEAAVIRMASASRDGLALTNVDSATLRRVAKALENRGLLTSELTGLGTARVYKPVAQDAIDWTGGEDKPADYEASKRAGAIVAQINRGGEVGKSLHGALFGEILSKESDNA